MQPDWSAIREQMLLAPGVTYLNTGSYGITPRTVFDHANEFRQLMQQNPLTSCGGAPVSGYGMRGNDLRRLSGPIQSVLSSRPTSAVPSTWWHGRCS